MLRRENIASSSSFVVSWLERILDAGWEDTASLILALTLWTWARVLWFRSVHFPLATSTEAMELAVTGHGFGLLFFPVSLLIVDQALRLEWVKSTLFITSSHLARRFSPRMFMRMSLFSGFSLSHAFLWSFSASSQSASQQGR